MALLALASERAASATFQNEPNHTLRTRHVMQQCFESLSNVMDQAVQPVWRNVVGSSLDKKVRAKLSKQVYAPTAANMADFRKRLQAMGFLTAYNQGGLLQTTLERFVAEKDPTFYLVRQIANNKHHGLLKHQRRVDRGLLLRGAGDMVVRQLKISSDDATGMLIVDVDGGSFNPLTNAYDAPLPSGSVRIADLNSFTIEGVPGEACDFVANACDALHRLLPDFERLAGSCW